jgi:hypothetical protein
LKWRRKLPSTLPWQISERDSRESHFIRLFPLRCGKSCGTRAAFQIKPALIQELSWFASASQQKLSSANVRSYGQQAAQAPRKPITFDRDSEKGSFAHLRLKW